MDGGGTLHQEGFRCGRVAYTKHGKRIDEDKTVQVAACGRERGRLVGSVVTVALRRCHCVERGVNGATLIVQAYLSYGEVGLPGVYLLCSHA